MFHKIETRLVMRKLVCVFCLFVFLLFSVKSPAQEIPNGDFEEWFTCLCDPPYWVTNNIYPPPLECLQVFPSGPPYSGNYCIEGIVDSCPQLVTLFPPLIQSFEIPISSRPEALRGFYKYIPIGEDLFVASIQTYLNSDLIGEGILSSQQSVSDYTEFIIDIEYTTNDIPDVALIKFAIDSSLATNKLHQGSKWYIDYLFFGPLSDVADEQTDIPNAFYLFQNYPNPYNPSTKIKFTIPTVTLRQAQSDIRVTLRVFDVLGNEVAALVNEEKTAGAYEITWDAASLPSGVYFYRLKAGDYVDTKKMILLK
jgi:hypothetical protein